MDANGDPNNQKLRLSFAKAGGGWAYKPSGWGDDPEKLNINRVPAFAGHFDLLDSQGNSLLASIEVDGEVIEVADGSEGSISMTSVLVSRVTPLNRSRLP